MSENLFSSKTKADLLQIVRMTGVLPIGKASKMRKAELVEFLEKEMNQKPAESSDAKEDNTIASKTTTESENNVESEEKTQDDSNEADKSDDKDDSEVSETTDEDKAKSDTNDSANKSNKQTSRTRTKSNSQSNKNRRSQRKSRNKNDNTKDEDNISAEISDEEEIIAKPRPRRKNYKVYDRNKKSTEENNTDTSDNNSKDNSPADNKQSNEKEVETEEATGVLEIMSDGYGFLRCENYIQGPTDVYVQAQFIKRFNMRVGDLVKGTVKNRPDQDRYRALTYVNEINGRAPDEMNRRANFERLTPIYADERYTLETTRSELSTRIIDLFSPIGKGQRGMIVSPPKAGKTILLQKIANAISINNPEAKLFVLLIDERPEEVTDMQRRIDGEVVYSTFDKSPENHVKISELVLEHAKRLVELGEDVVILVDSLTRMARAYNLTINPTGRTLSGGLDPGALHHPKRFFGAARNIEGGGSLTIVATSLVETGSRMDEVIFEEFKGTGNMEVYLDRKLSEKRIFPAIDVNRSSTRREELLLSPKELESIWAVRRAFGSLDTSNVTELILSLLTKTKDNEHMIESLNISLKDSKVLEVMKSKSDSHGNGNHYNHNNY